MKPFSQNQLRDYSSLFSRNQAEAWLKCNFHSINYKINRYDSDWICNKKQTYRDYLKYVYSILEVNYANEYVVKNSFLNEWLIPQIGKNKTTVFNEFRVGEAVADLVLFNGNSKVFEIKTELDSEYRLEIQIKNYRKAFNEIFLIVPENKLQSYKKYDGSIGLISYNLNKGKKFIIERPSPVNYNIDALTIMNILRSNEYKSLIQCYYKYVPEMTSFSQYKVCRNLLHKIPSNDLNNLFIVAMKNRKRSSELSSRYFREFNQLSLSLKLDSRDKQTLISNLNTCIKD